jgi:hypothetical protein
MLEIVAVYCVHSLAGPADGTDATSRPITRTAYSVTWNAFSEKSLSLTVSSKTLTLSLRLLDPKKKIGRMLGGQNATAVICCMYRIGNRSHRAQLLLVFRINIFGI